MLVVLHNCVFLLLTQDTEWPFPTVSCTVDSETLIKFLYSVTLKSISPSCTLNRIFFFFNFKITLDLTEKL